MSGAWHVTSRLDTVCHVASRHAVSYHVISAAWHVASHHVHACLPHGTSRHGTSRRLDFVTSCQVASRHGVCRSMARHATSRLVMSLSHHVTSRHVLSCRDTSCHVRPCHVTSRRVASCCVLSRHVVSCLSSGTSRHVRSRLVRSHHVALRRVLSCNVASRHVTSWRVAPCESRPGASRAAGCAVSHAAQARKRRAQNVAVGVL